MKTRILAFSFVEANCTNTEYPLLAESGRWAERVSMAAPDPKADIPEPNLRVTPAMAAGISDRVCLLEELVEQTSK
jgi:hypothetical protein